MECPFCKEDFNDLALVCKSCGRDLRLVRPLIEENARLIQKIDEVQVQVSRLRASLARTDTPLRFWAIHLSAYVIAPVVLLIGAHYLVTIAFNVPLLYLRLASIAIPIPFGFALLLVSHHGVRWAIGYGAAVGLIAVGGMLIVVGWTDKIPILPEDAREWREALEYASSIMLAFTTGNVLAALLQRLLPRTLDATSAPGPAAIMLARLTGGLVVGAALRRRAQKIQDNFGTVGTALGALGTAGGSLYTGIRVLMTAGS
jgi:hypothetical protein